MVINCFSPSYRASTLLSLPLLQVTDAVGASATKRGEAINQGVAVTRTPGEAFKSSQDYSRNEPEISMPSSIQTPLKSALRRNRAKYDKIGKMKLEGGVHFNVDANGEIEAEVFIVLKVEAIYRRDMFMSRKEQAETQFFAASEGESFLIDNDELVEELNRAYLSCCRDDVSAEAEEKNEEAIRKWVKHGVRGLEDAVSAVSHEERSLASAMILDYQLYLRETLGSSEDSDELLRTFSECVTSRSRQFASKIGAADAIRA